MGIIRNDPPAAPRAETALAPARRLQNLLTPTRDGVMLAADVLLPPGEGPFPTILRRTPYNKNDTLEAPTPLMEALLAAGYALVVQDCRGRFNSGGEFDPYFQESADGIDTIAWVATQPWCDGRIGMIGASYSGATQWYAATGGHEALKAIVPFCSNPASPWDNEPIRGGVMLSIQVEFAIAMGHRAYQHRNFGDALYAEDRPSSWVLPVTDMAGSEGANSPFLERMLSHPNWDDYWEAGSFADWESIRVPALHVTGWWDLNFPGALLNFPAMRARGATPEARRGQELIIGPWAHETNRGRCLNGVDFGEEAVIDLDGQVLRFLDQHVRGIAAAETRSPVHVFVIGANEWWSSDSWPLAEAEERALYLHSGGSANTLNGDGRLTWDPALTEPPDQYVYDPANPVHAFFHSMSDGPVDDRLPSLRQDVLCYSSDPLVEPLDVVGPVSFHLWAASSARDTDWHARLVDVWPDGTARYLCHGVLRARFRDGYDQPSLIEPEVPYRFVVDMDAVGVRFLPGHRIRVEVTSSWFPRYTRNTNSGAANPYADAEIVVAQQSILHDSEHLSCLLLPIIPAADGER